MSTQTTMPLIVENATKGSLLVSHGKVANTFFTRFKGLMGVASLQKGDGLLIIPGNSIHTHFMRFPIDVLYLDKTWRVVAIDENMKPWRIGRIHRNAHSVLELPAGMVAATDTQVGDQLEVRGL